MRGCLGTVNHDGAKRLPRPCELRCLLAMALLLLVVKGRNMPLACLPASEMPHGRSASYFDLKLGRKSQRMWPMRFVYNCARFAGD